MVLFRFKSSTFGPSHISTLIWIWWYAFASLSSLCLQFNIWTTKWSHSIVIRQNVNSIAFISSQKVNKHLRIGKSSMWINGTASTVMDAEDITIKIVQLLFCDLVMESAIWNNSMDTKSMMHELFCSLWFIQTYSKMLWIWKCIQTYGLEMPLLAHLTPSFRRSTSLPFDTLNVAESNWNRIRARNNLRWSKTEAANVISYMSSLVCDASLRHVIGIDVVNSLFWFLSCSLSYLQSLPYTAPRFAFNVPLHRFPSILLASFSAEWWEKLSLSHTCTSWSKNEFVRSSDFATIAQFALLMSSTQTHTHTAITNTTNK